MTVLSKKVDNNAQLKELVTSSGLEHIAVIMDGNRRWAKKRFLPTAAGHSEGVKALKRLVRFSHTIGLKNITVYAFSTENWGRKQEEVDFLMELLAKTVEYELSELYEENVKISFIGDLTRFSPKLRKILDDAMTKTHKNTGITLQIAINYGARDELKNAVAAIAQKVKDGELLPESITEQTISDNLYTKDVKDPDLLIRTGGEMRISNYLLWQIAYSEFFVTQTLWPDFDKEDIAEAIQTFASRHRRFGKD
ncbi:MAG: isoprenyl transferase [Candidatus Gastranaerophilales bacterium]|nr:isoprenyl transferase [Candidatus Gastranaerophilales bacterium]